MKKKLSSIVLLLATLVIAHAQGKRIDTLRLALSKAKEQDTVRLNILKNISVSYYISKPDSGLIFGQQYYELATRLNRVQDQGIATNYMGIAYRSLGDFERCFSSYLKAVDIFESINYVEGVVSEYCNIGDACLEKKEYLKALPFQQLGLKKWSLYALNHKLTTLHQKSIMGAFYLNTAEVFLYTNKIDSADYYLKLCYTYAGKFHLQELIGLSGRDLGEVETERGHKTTAINYYQGALTVAVQTEDVTMQCVTYLSIADLYHKYKQQDSAEYYSVKALETASEKKLLKCVLSASDVLCRYYEEDHNLPQVIKTLKLKINAKDSIFAQDMVKQVLSSNFENEQKEQQINNIRAAQKKTLDNVKMYVIMTSAFILLLLVFIFWQGNKQRQKAYNTQKKSRTVSRAS